MDDRPLELLPHVVHLVNGDAQQLCDLARRQIWILAADLHVFGEQVASAVRKRGLVVLISDLLANTDLLQTRLGYLRSQGHEVVLLRILDPTEIDFKFDKPAMFVDPETGKDLYVDPSTARAIYQKNFNKHADEIRKTCDELGIDFYQFSTGQPLELALSDFLQARMHLGRTKTHSGRRGVATGGVA